MTRSLLASAALTVTTLTITALTAAPAQAQAPTQSVFGYAWADGKGALRVTPVSARLVRSQGVPRHELKALPGARELRLTYGGADFRRLTAGCDLKETEGRVALDSAGLGTTRCKPADLTFTLGLGPNPVRIDHEGGRAVRVSEFMPAKWYTRTARGVLQRVDSDTVRLGSTQLGYTWGLAFNRVTAKCTDGWLTGEPVNADESGLGTKACSARDFTKVFTGSKLAEVHYNPYSGELFNVWEIYGDA
ncbi:hypothetical protein [Nonomuraea longicatena]|uniref:Lipoprotein n=1 Tax=Nonomuraea longicatena TaxID=83682 RepID=A0ABP4BGH6_9ACTN